MCEYHNFSKLLKIILEEKSNDFCIADEVDTSLTILITYKRKCGIEISKRNYLNECAK